MGQGGRTGDRDRPGLIRLLAPRGRREALLRRGQGLLGEGRLNERRLGEGVGLQLLLRQEPRAGGEPAPECRAARLLAFLDCVFIGSGPRDLHGLYFEN